MTQLRLLLGAVVVLTTLFAAAPAHAGVARRALVVGANDGGMDLERLRYAEDDAWRMAETLVDLGGFDQSDVVVLAGPTVAELSQWLEAYAELSSAEDEELFVFYYSGHADARGLRLGEGTYSFDALKSDMQMVDADVKLGILDACRSGAITQVKGARVVDPFLGERLATQGEVWITASSADEGAQESDRLKGSFFTHHLVTGLRGAADDGDGVISLTEAYSYAYDNTLAATDGTYAGAQHPEYDYRLSGQGDLNLTRVTANDARVTLNEGFGGRVLILSEPSMELVAEIAKDPGERIVLALPAGRYRLRRRDGDEIYEMRLKLSGSANFTIDDRWGSSVLEVASTKGPVAQIGPSVEWAVVEEATAPLTPGQKLDRFLAATQDESVRLGTEMVRVFDQQQAARAEVRERMAAIDAEQYAPMGRSFTVVEQMAFRRQIKAELREEAERMALKGGEVDD
jgi:hypothetical protein